MSHCARRELGAFKDNHDETPDDLEVANQARQDFLMDVYTSERDTREQPSVRVNGKEQDLATRTLPLEKSKVGILSSIRHQRDDNTGKALVVIDFTPDQAERREIWQGSLSEILLPTSIVKRSVCNIYLIFDDTVLIFEGI